MVDRCSPRTRSTVGALGALAALTAGLTVLAPGAGASQTPAVSITSFVDGAAPFSSGNSAGQDASATNGRVRAGDPVTVGVRIVPGGTTGLTDFSVVADVAVGSGAITWSAPLPTGCSTGADAGSVHCDFGPRPVNQAIDLTFSGVATERAAAGDLAAAVSVSSGGTPVSHPLVVTAAPLVATPTFTEPRFEGPATVDGVDGVVVVYGLQVAASATTAMVSAAAGSTFDVDLDVSAIPGARVLGCSANGADGGAVVYSAAVSDARTALDADATARVAGGGTWACTPGGAGAHATVTGVDTNPDSFPTTAWNRSPLGPDAGVLTSGAVRVFVPLDSIGSGLTAAVSSGPVHGPSALGAGTTRQDQLSADHVGTLAPGLIVVHTVNGALATAEPGLTVAEAAPLHYAAVVVNTGNVELTGLAATDPAVPALAEANAAALAPGASWSFAYDTVQPAGPLASVLTVTGTGADTPVVATHEVRSAPPVVVEGPLSLPGPDVVPDAGTPALLVNAVTLKVYVDGQLFTALPGPIAIIGQPNLIEFEVKNSSASPITNVLVDDSSITTDATAIDCGKDATTKNKIPTLAANETVTCSELVTPANATAVTFTAAVTVNAVADASLAAGYQPKAAAIDIELGVNGQDADASPGVSVTTGATLTLSYVLRNTGQVDVASVEISHENDDNGDFLDIVCASLGADTDNDAIIDLIKPGESVNCTFTITAVAGVFTTKAVAIGNPVAADETVLENDDGAIEVTDSDPIFYTGASGGGGSGTTTTTQPGTIGNGGANSGPLALAAGLVFLSGLGLWGLSRRRRFAR